MPKGTKPVLPIQFAIPSCKIRRKQSEKKRLFSHIVPGITPYQFTIESEYYDHYAESFFAVTTRKSGWDCLRHYEILCNGSIPFFPDLQACPNGTLAFFPKELILTAMSLLKRRPWRIVKSLAQGEGSRMLEVGIDVEEVLSGISEELLNYTRQQLSTQSLAERTLKLVGSPQRVLILSSVFGMDYQRESLAHGLLSCQDTECDIFPDIPWLFTDFPEDQCRSLYGNGFGFARTLSRTKAPAAREDIQKKIESRAYDAVFLCGTGNFAGDSVSEWSRCLSRTPAKTICWVDGSDQFGDHRIPEICHIAFRRESKSASKYGTWIERRIRNFKATGRVL